MDEALRTLTLELAELICIEHALSPSARFAEQDVNGLSDYAPSDTLCLRIGSALLEAITSQDTVTVSVSGAELWLLRERVSIYTSQGASADLGLVIKTKVYAALISIADELSLTDAGIKDAPGDTDGNDEPSHEEVKDALEAWREAHPGTPGYPKAHTDPNADDPEDGSGK